MDQADELDSKTNNGLTHFDPDGPTYVYMPLLIAIAKNSAGQLNNDPTFLLKKLDDSEKGPALRKKLVEAWNERKYQSIRDIDYLRPLISPSTSGEVYAPTTSEQAAATENAWTVNYVGKAARALLLHIKDFLPKAPRDDPPKDPKNLKKRRDRRLYARYTMIVQSSGMGKSRTVDEMAKSTLVIPMVLRSERSTGYPPTDLSVRKYLTDPEFGRYPRVLAFLHALFDEVASLAKGEYSLKEEGLPSPSQSEPFAAQFRAYMNHGMSMQGHGKFRIRFYQKVAREAERIWEDSYKSIGPNIISPKMNSKTKRPRFPLNVAFEKLLEALMPFANRKKPFVILSLDESDSLGQNFLHFRRALRTLLSQRIFTLFLSTSSHMYEFIPNPTVDSSNRIIQEGCVVPPFSELGFDHFALRRGEDAMVVDEVTLSHISSTPELVKLGRPLWATRYNGGDDTLKDEIIVFAASKLLGGITPSDKSQLTLPRKLACLAQRLPIEFLSVSYSSSLADPQSIQIRSHLRVVIRIVDNLETMITVSPSEPILSEAAYWLMSNPQFTPAAALKGILGGFSVNSGDRGELLVMLLLTIARDHTIGPPDEFGVPSTRNRTCSLMSFLSNLFVESHWDAAVGDKMASMKRLFGDSKLFFNHFVKVHEFKMLNTEYILALMARGAAIVCATSQKGIDLVIPFTLKGNTLARGNIGVILIQVKNDKNYTAKPKPAKLKRMSITGLSDIPNLRFFFALAAKKSCITIVDAPPQRRDTFSFWIAGLFSEILCPVKDEGDDTWHALLNASYRWKEIYIERGDGKKEKRNRITNLRRSMNPGCATDSAHWRSWWKLQSERDEDEDGADSEGGGTDEEDDEDDDGNQKDDDESEGVDNENEEEGESEENDDEDMN